MRYTIVIVMALLMQACGSLTPCRTDQNQFMDAQAQIQINLSMSEDQLVEFANQLVPDTLFNDDDLGGQDIAVLVEKNGIPSLKLRDRTAQITLPLNILAERNMGFLRAKAEGSLFLTVSSTIDIQKDWSWSTQTVIDEVHWVKEPKLKVMGLQLSVGKMIEDYLTSNEKEITDQIDQAVKDNQLLQKAIQDARPSFERSYPLDPEGTFYIQAVPVRAGLSPFQVDGKQILLSTKLNGKAELLSDSSGMEDVADPDFYWIEPQDEPYNVFASVSLKEEEVARLIEEGALDQEFEFRGKKSKVRKVDVSLQDRKIKADVYLTGGIKGMIHFEGQPTWDKDDNELKFCRTEMETNIDKGLPKWLLWLGKGAVEKQIVKRMEKEINKEIEARIDEVNSHLKDYKLSPRMTVSGDIYDYDLDPLLIEDRMLKLGILANVRGKLAIDNLELRIE